MHSHEYFMQLALEQAQIGETVGEIPVGAVLTLGGTVVAVGYNQTVSKCDPTAHAEIIAIRKAAEILGNYRLTQCALYVTLEPCAMCMGAILHSRISKLYFGAVDPKTGACGSVLNIPGEPRINHHCEAHGGILQMQCAQHLTAYFQRLRDDKRRNFHVFLREDALRMDPRTLAPLIPRAESLPIDDLSASEGLRVQTWRSPHSSQSPECLVLCLHGATSWSYLYRDLFSAEIPADVAVWAIDLPGYGGSDKTKKGQELRDSAFQIRILTELLQRVTAQRIHIVAQDIGCGLGMRLAAAIPDRIFGFTLLNPAGSDLKPSDSDGMPAVRSRQQFTAYINKLSEGEESVAKALCAPYPDAGHMAGMLDRFNALPVANTSRCSLSTLQKCAGHSVVHVGHMHLSEYLQFKVKFGLTFQVVEHRCSSAFIGLKNPSIWDGVLQQVNANG